MNATVAGGLFNTANGPAVTVAGCTNLAEAEASTVRAGVQNKALGATSTVAGGSLVRGRPA